MKEELKLLIDDKKVLWARTESGIEYRLDVFEGGGSYAALWPRTEAEIEAAQIAYEKSDKEWRDNVSKRIAAEEARPWYKKLIPFL